MLMIGLKTNIKLDEESELKLKEILFKAASNHLSSKEQTTLLSIEDGVHINLGVRETDDIFFLDVNAYEKLPEIECNRFATRVSETIEKEFGVRRENVYTIFEKSVYWAKNGSKQVLDNNYIPVKNGMFVGSRVNKK